MLYFTHISLTAYFLDNCIGIILCVCARIYFLILGTLNTIASSKSDKQQHRLLFHCHISADGAYYIINTPIIHIHKLYRYGLIFIPITSNGPPCMFVRISVACCLRKIMNGKIQRGKKQDIMHTNTHTHKRRSYTLDLFEVGDF